MGVRQRCVLSPTLFNLYVSEFQKKNEQGGFIDCVKISEVMELSCIIWAADIIFLSETKSGLQNQLEFLKSYCASNVLDVNLSKTKCMYLNFKILVSKVL